MIPHFDLPTTQKSVTWTWWRRFWRGAADVLNRLLPENFLPNAGFTLAKREFQYAEQIIEVGRLPSPLPAVPVTVAVYKPRGTGRIIRFFLRATEFASMPVGPFTFRILDSGGGIVSAVTISNADGDEDVAVAEDFTAATGAYRIVCVAQPAGAPVNIYWSVGMRVRTELS